jgi:hypothetical protein
LPEPKFTLFIRPLVTWTPLRDSATNFLVLTRTDISSRCSFAAKYPYDLTLLGLKHELPHVRSRAAAISQRRKKMTPGSMDLVTWPMPVDSLYLDSV